MSEELSQDEYAAVSEAVAELQRAAAAKKCWPCACLHSSLAAIERAFPASERPAELDAVMHEARERLQPVRYDCLGCDPCYPPLAMNALVRAGAEQLLDLPPCPSDTVKERAGWPPFPGAYTVLRYHAPVAVCTLTDEALGAAVAREAGPEVAIVGTLQTENLGIERLILNALANPNIRFLVVCGPDSRQAVGHLPGQSLVALSQAGTDDRSRIVGAKGKRPVLKNIGRESIEHFRRTVEVVNLVGSADVSEVLCAVATHAARNPGPAEPFAPQTMITAVRGYLPERMIPDPTGYFVVYVDRKRCLLSLEHYSNDGVLDMVIEGASAAELYIPAIDKGLVFRLDHAAYLGRELARAERSLQAGEPFIQDRAPEQSAFPADSQCGCGPSCQEPKL